MGNKEIYAEWCKENYVPIFSQPYWMDAMCGEENWDVWLYGNGTHISAAMPYYRENRGKYKYITKALLTQNNGILFERNEKRKAATFASFQEKVVNAACDFIKELHLDVYEQQYHHSFVNWSPFYWNHYTCIVRYTYVIKDTSDMGKVFEDFTANYRKNIRKGQKYTTVCTDLSPDEFYVEHAKIFAKQNLKANITLEQWHRLYNAVQSNGTGQMICARDDQGNIHSLMYVIWDQEAMYPILGGYMPEFSSSQSYPALTYYSIGMAHEKGLSYDFEGSMLHQVAKSFRQFGGEALPYYRIRKIFNPDIIRMEAEASIKSLEEEMVKNSSEEEDCDG